MFIKYLTPAFTLGITPCIIILRNAVSVNELSGSIALISAIACRIVRMGAIVFI
jgi:hypothetical protein